MCIYLWFELFFNDSFDLFFSEEIAQIAIFIIICLPLYLLLYVYPLSNEIFSQEYKLAIFIESSKNKK